MKKNGLVNFMAIGLLIAGLSYCTPAEPAGQETPESQTVGREYYQLKEYTFTTDSQELVTDQYLENAFMPATKRQGIANIGVFKSRPDETDSLQRTYVLIPFESLDQFASLETKLVEDAAYLEAGSAYLDAPHDRPPYQRVVSTILIAFPDMPKMAPTTVTGPRSERVYELRSYESPNETYYRNKVDMFNAGGEVTLFDQLEFHAVFYGDVLSGAKMPNLMYMTTFTDMESRDAHWKLFVDAPAWKEMSSLPKYQNNVSHADIHLLYPTEYSDY